MIADDTTELVDGIGAAPLVEAIADELEAVYQSSVSNQRFLRLPFA
jgi:hypothetical protein